MVSRRKDPATVHTHTGPERRDERERRDQKPMCLSDGGWVGVLERRPGALPPAEPTTNVVSQTMGSSAWKTCATGNPAPFSPVDSYKFTPILHDLSI